MILNKSSEMGLEMANINLKIVYISLCLAFDSFAKCLVNSTEPKIIHKVFIRNKGYTIKRQKMKKTSVGKEFASRCLNKKTHFYWCG